MLTNNFIPHLVCNDFRSFKKGVCQIDESTETVTSLSLCNLSDAQDFIDFVSKFVDLTAIKAFRKGDRDYAYNLRYIKAMLCCNGQSAHLNGFVGLVSKKSLFEAMQTIENFYLKNSVNYS